MEDRLSQDNISHNNLRDSASNGGGIQIRNKNVNGGSVNSLQGGKNEIIPERRRKYLGGGSDDNYLAGGGAPSVGQQMMGIDSAELTDEKTVHKKNNKLNVHL
jgi:hypothetical protein